MSIPLVGCEAINKEGLSSNSRPTTNFCWLPPESAVASVLVFGVFTSNKEITFSDSLIAFLVLTVARFDLYFSIFCLPIITLFVRFMSIIIA